LLGSLVQVQKIFLMSLVHIEQLKTVTASVEFVNLDTVTSVLLQDGRVDLIKIISHTVRETILQVEAEYKIMFSFWVFKEFVQVVNRTNFGHK